MKPGKAFEDDFKKSVPECNFIYKLKDNFRPFDNDPKDQNSTYRFTQSSPCDYIMLISYLYMLELKSVKGKSKALAEQEQKQIVRLLKYANKKNTIPGFVINFRDHGLTYFIHIQDIVSFIEETGKKSINIDDCKKYGLLIPQKLLRVRSRYSVIEFDDKVKESLGA